MLKKARGREIETVLSDIENLPFRKSSFNSVIFSASIFLVPSPEKALKEAIRVTARNGVIGGNYPIGFFHNDTDVLKMVGLRHRLISDKSKVEKAIEIFGGEIREISFKVNPEFMVDFYSIPSMGRAVLKDMGLNERMMHLRRIFLSDLISRDLSFHWRVFRIRV